MHINPRINKSDKALIIGARGNLGGQVMRVFGNDYRLLCWDKEDLNILDFVQTREKILAHKPDIIINTAAYNAVDKCEESAPEFELAKKINGGAVGNLSDIALELNAVLIHISSDYVFGGGQSKGYIEEDKPQPINKYGESKLLGEHELLIRASRGLKYYLVRTSKLFGPRGESALTKPSFFDIMLKLAKENSEINVVNDELSCFTYTLDLARAIKGLLEKNKPYGTYHIVNEGAATWYESVVELFKIAKIKTAVNPVSGDKFPRPAKRPKYSVLLNTKCDKLRSYKEALREYLSDRKIKDS